MTAVFASALSEAAWEFASTSQVKLEELFCAEHVIIRQGGLRIFTVPETRINGHVASKPPLLALEFRIVVSEPVLQGRGKLHFTRFFVAPPSCEEGVDGGVTLSNGFNGYQPDSPTSEEFEIDEHFLAGSVLRPLIRRPPYGSSTEVTDSSQASESGDALSQAEPARPREDLIRKDGLVAHPMSNAVDVEGAEHIVYMRPEELGRLGIFSGDWASLSILSSHHVDNNLLATGNSVTHFIARLAISESASAG